MTKLAPLWAGRLYGTNTGNLFAELDHTDSAVKGTIRLLEDRFGPHVFGVVGTFDGSKFEVSAKPTQLPDGVTVGETRDKRQLDARWQLAGRMVFDTRNRRRLYGVPA